VYPILDEADVLVIGVIDWDGVFDQQEGIVNAGQRVVDFMGDTSGQLFTLPECLFHPLVSV
jgi:hypothetical protein